MNEVGTVDVSPVMELFSQAMVEVAEAHGFWILFLAVIGGLSLMNAAGRIANPGLKWGAIIFIVTPIIAIRSVVDKQYGEALSKEFIDIKQYLHETPKAKRFFIRYIGGICLIGVLFVGYSIIKIKKEGLI